MEQNPSGKPDSRLNDPEFSCLSWEQTSHYHYRKIQLLVLLRSQINPIQNFNVCADSERFKNNFDIPILFKKYSFKIFMHVCDINKWTYTSVYNLYCFWF